MKRYGNLYPQILEFKNLLAAARQAQRSKRFRENVLEFNYHLERELLQIKEELATKTYCPGDYNTFTILEPKPRQISAAPYRDRVIHHALCNIIVPLIEPTFIGDSYANRVGLGTHKALQRFTTFARSSQYILQGDIRKYFPSIDHEVLKAILRRKIKCRDTLWLIDRIIDRSNPQEPVIEYFPGDDLITPVQRRRGLPIGNLTSQFFANVYLSGFDRFVKENLKAKKYLRYVDDFALFSDDLAFLETAKSAIHNYLEGLRLKLHPTKTQIFATRYGANFLGFRILSDRLRVSNDNLRRARRRLRQMQRDCTEGKCSEQQMQQSLQSWFAHLQHGDTWRLREQICSSLAAARN